MSKSARLRAQRRMQSMRVTNEQAEAIADGRTWYRMVNLVEQPSVAAIYLYDEIGYWGVTAQDFVRDLMGLRVDTIILHINSPGGEVFDGLAIYHALRDHPATVESRVDGVAASAASFIACAGDNVVMQRNATMMIHDASMLCFGNAEELQKTVDMLDMQSDNIADIYMQQAGGTVEQWRAAMRAETWYSADEALAVGLCDEVNNADEETDEPAAVVPGEDADEFVDLMAKSYDLSVFAYHYKGRAEAPAPQIADHADEPEAPAVEQPEEPAAAVEPEAPADVDPEEPTAVDVPAVEPEPAPVAQADPPGDEPDEDMWAAFSGGLLTNATPSTVDELFAALQKEGTLA